MAKDNRTDEQRHMDLVQALIELRRFGAKAEEYIKTVDAHKRLDEQYGDGKWRNYTAAEVDAYREERHALPSVLSLNAAVKRASMDLTKALAKYRNG